MRILLFIFSFLMIQTNSFSQGIEFFHGSWEEALEKAQADGKVIFVDAYAEWCGPCKRMAKTTFKDQKVGDFFNANFLNVKMDMEKGDGPTFRRKYPVSAFPTLFFLDPNGEVVHKQKGAQKVDGLMKMAKFALSKVDYSADYAKLYEEGNREPQLVYDYVQALNKSNKPSLKIANEYLNSQDDLTTDFNQKFILEGASEADSRIFDMLIKNRSNIEKLTSKEAVQKKIQQACERTVQKAIEYQSDDLLEVAKSAMKKHAPQEAKKFNSNADLVYYREMGDSKNYLKCCNDYVKKQAKNDAAKLHGMALEIRENFGTNKDAMSVAEKVAKKAVDHSEEPKFYITYAKILSENGKNADALKIAKKTLDLTKEDKRAQMQINRFIEQLEQS